MFQENNFSPAVDLTTTKFIKCFSLQGGWSVKHSDFEMAFASGRIHQPVFSKILQYVYNEHEKMMRALCFDRSLYGLTNGAII